MYYYHISLAGADKPLIWLGDSREAIRGFPDGARLIAGQKAIAARGLKQGEAAELLEVTQPRVSDLMRGRIDLFSIDTLIDMLAKLGIRARIVLQPGRRRAGVA